MRHEALQIMTDFYTTLHSLWKQLSSEYNSIRDKN